jgi:hypothetical protein
MPFGLPVWTILWGMSLSLMAASFWVGSAWAARTASAIFAAYVAVRIVDGFPISGELQILCFAAIWVIASCFVPLGGAGDNVSPLIVRACMALAGACYLWARLTGAPRVFGSAPYVVSDLLLIAAMLLIGWPLRHDIRSAFVARHGGWDLGRDSCLRSIRPGSPRGLSHNQKAQAKEISRGASNV